MGMEIVNPRFDAINVIGEWGDATKPGPWAKEVAIYLVDLLHLSSGLFGKKKPLPLGDMYTLVVCSEEFKSNPDETFERSVLDKALVMTTYNESEVCDYLESKINSIGEVSVRQLDERLQLYMDPHE